MDRGPRDHPSSGPSSAVPASGTKARPGWGLLAALTALNILSFVDRQLVVTLAPLLMEDLGLTRAEIGLLVGASFIVVFSGLTLVMGAAADRFGRPRLIALGLGAWSVATAATGAARSFAHLVLLRTAVGVGEATLSPAALSMLSDRFPPARLGFASSVFYAGIPLGFALSFVLAGFIGPWLGWRACFVLLGLSGLVAVVAVAAMRDPGRTGSDRRERLAPVEMARGLVRAIVDRPAIALVSLAGALFAFASGASQHVITWLVQERGFEYSRAAFLSAAVVAGGGLVGNIAMGVLTDRGRRLHPAGRLVVTALLSGLAFPLACAFYLMPPTSPFFVPVWFLAQAWMLGWFGPVLAALAELAPSGLRATVLGFGLLTINLLGVALGPWVAGFIGDRTSLTAGLVASLAVGAMGLVPLLAAAWLLARPAAASASRAD